MSQERFKDLNLTPPEEGFELYRYKNAEKMRTSGWSGLYWARKNEAGDYEIRAVTKKGRGTPTLGRVLQRGLREILREGRLDSAATPSLKGGGTVGYRHSREKPFQGLLELAAVPPRRTIPAT
jgi:hypothetical protein